MIMLKVPGDMDGLSAKKFLEKQMHNTQEIEQLFAEGKVRSLAFGKKLLPATPVRKGSTVLVVTEKTAEGNRYFPEIVYEDEEFLVFNKPQGMTCINRTDTEANLYRYVVERMEQQGEYDVDTLRVPYVCNLLDKEAGGLVIIAKDQILFEHMLEALKERRIKRIYRVIVTGDAQESALLHGFMEQGNAFSKAAMQEKMNRNARPAALKYRLLEKRGELSLLEVEPMSNYRQQIPLQLAKAGLPVLGDKQYGSNEMNKKFAIYAPAMWAYKIVFETGRNNYMEYLTGKEIEGSVAHMPGIGYFMEREEPLTRVEPLNEKQIKQAAKLAQEVFMAQVAPGYSKQGVQAFRDYIKPAKLAKLAEQQALQLYGCYGVEGMQGVIAVQPDGHISLLFVKEEYQNTGAGSLLMQHVEEAANVAGVLRLGVHSAPGAVAFYEKCGFTVLSEPIEQDGIVFVPMEKILK